MTDSAQWQEEAFRRVLAHRTMLKACVQAIVRDPFLAEDTFWDVTLEIARSWEHFDPNRPFAPWARGLARRVALANLRKHHRPLVLAPDGRQLGAFKGRHNTIDVAADGASKTVATIGWRQANAFDGRRKEPVQISHLTGRGYDGAEKCHLYDWSVDPNAPGFINQPANNMADTRGYRVAMGADGKLHAAFECAGGNHIFRYEPRLVNGAWIGAKDKKAKGDNYHAFHNSRAEHKTCVARFDPATGEFLRGQEFTARLSNGRANAVRVKGGAVAGGTDGSLDVGGTAAFGLPVSLLAPGTGDHTGDGFVLGLKPALDGRLFCLRLQAGAETHAVDARQVGGKTVVVCAGTTSAKPEPFWTKNAIQAEAPPKSGFFAVFTGE